MIICKTCYYFGKNNYDVEKSICGHPDNVSVVAMPPSPIFGNISNKVEVSLCTVINKECNCILWVKKPKWYQSEKHIKIKISNELTAYNYDITIKGE